MCARFLACPLCSQPGFLTLDALRVGLVSVATRPLACPVCNEVLLGIDKLTIHLFSHSINHHNSEPPKVIDISAGVDVCAMVRNVPSIPLQTWSIMNKPKSNCAEENKRDFQNKETNQVIFLPKDNANEETCTESQNFLDKPANQQVIFLHNKENLREGHGPDRNSIILLQGKEPLRLENQEKPTNLFLVQGKDKDVRDHGTNQMLLLAEKHQDKNPTNRQMIFLQEKDCPREKGFKRNQDNSIKSGSNQPVIYLQNSEQIRSECLIHSEFAQNVSYCGDHVECQELVSETDSGLIEETWNQNNQELPLAVTLTCEEENDDSTTNPVEHEKQTQSELSSSGAVKTKTERCDICGFYFPDQNILTLHKQVTHMVEKGHLNAASEHLFKNYPCYLCTKVFKMRGSLMVHMRVAHSGCSSSCSSKELDTSDRNENGFNCPTCGKNFKKEQHVTQHLKTHEGKQWECDVCSKMFTTKYFLKKHKRLHSGEMPYKCSICDKTFTFQQSYHKHRLYHKDDKPHTCNTCGRSFKELSTLHNHERIHTGEKPFACESCGKCFRQRVSYLVHRRIHTGVMPYKCSACGKSFRYKVSQRTHKCPMQPPGTLVQPESLVQKLLQSPEPVSNAPNQEVVGLDLDVENNKYVLIVNDQGQHVLTRQSEVEAVQTNKLGKSNNSEQVDYKKQQLDEPSDFFSMVMSPLGNDLSSPSAEMEHLRLSSPVDQANILEINDHVMTQDNYSDNTNALHTINEESLKELLYGIGNK